MAINPITVDLPAGLLAADFSPWSPEARARSSALTGRDLGLLYTEPVIPRYAPEYSWDVSGMPSVSEYKYGKEPVTSLDVGDSSLPTVTTVPGSEGGGVRWTDPDSVTRGADGTVPDVSMSTLPVGTIVISHITGEPIPVHRDDEGHATLDIREDPAPGFIRDPETGEIVPESGRPTVVVDGVVRPIEDVGVVGRPDLSPPPVSAPTPPPVTAPTPPIVEVGGTIRPIEDVGVIGRPDLSPVSAPTSTVPDFAAYVDSYPDLKAATAGGYGSASSKYAWGKWHYESYGRGEGRTVPEMLDLVSILG
jgi:hypothetical protein